MNENIWYGLGFVAGVVLISVICVIIMLLATKKGKSLKSKYDERQEIIRGRGFKYGFYTMMGCNMLYATVEIGFGKLPVENTLVLFLIALLGVCVYAWYCILHDGYFALNDKPKAFITCMFIIAIINIVIGVMEIYAKGLFRDGMLSYNSMNFMCGIFILLTDMVMIIKKVRDRKEE